MTEQEALEILEKSAKDNELIGKGVEVLNMAVQALQKQIPQKVEGSDYQACPVCGRELTDFIFGDSFCPSCGQKLSWN